MKTLISKEELHKKIKSLADTINNTCQDELNILCVLKGGVMFMAELVKHLKMPVKIDFIELSSYQNSITTSGKVENKTKDNFDFYQKDVLIVEDIVDTGLTMDFLVKYLKQNHNPKTIKIASLLNKKVSRKCDIKPDFYCFDVDDKFVVGFGLDYQGLYRNLDYIGYIEK